MKVLVVSNLYPPDVCGGYEMGCRQAVDALRERGHDVRVLTTAPRTPCKSPPHVIRTLRLTDLWDPYTDSRSFGVTLRLKQGEAFQINAFNVHGLLQAIESFQPDVVYLWMLAGIGGLGLISALRHLRVPWVWHLMDEVPTRLCWVIDSVRPELAREFSRRFRGRFLACSQQIVDEIERRGFTLRDQVEIVPNWVTGALPPTRTDFYDRTRPLRIVAAAATIDRSYDKGIDLLIHAARHLRDQGRDAFSLELYGRVKDTYYADLIRSLGLTRHVILRGAVPQSELVQRYRDHDVFAFPGRPDEPFGFAPLEAMPSGCVPILSRRVGIGEWLVHGVHCLKVGRSVVGFAEAFASILDGGINLAAIGRRAATAARHGFHIDAHIPSIERALEQEARRSREGAGDSDEAYRLALLAEKLMSIFLQESLVA